VAVDPQASELARALTDRGLAAAVRSLPPWPSATSNVGDAITVELAGRPRPLALVEWWKVTAVGPPSLSEARWAIQERESVPWQDIVATLVDLAARWAEKPEALGLLDVVFALFEALPATDGGWRAHVLDREVWLGVQRDRLRWPAPLRIDVRRGMDIMHDPPGPGRRRTWSIVTRDDFERDRAEIVACVAAHHAWCERFVAEKRALEKFADRVCVELGKTHLPPAGHWHVDAPSVFAFSTRDRPVAWICWDGGRTHITTDEDGRGVVDGVTYPDDTPMAALADVIAGKARTCFDLRIGELYRLKQARGGLLAGDVLRFRRSGEVHDGSGFYELETADPHLGRGDSLLDGRTRFRGLTLYDADPEDARVVQSPGDWFTPVVDPAARNARHVESLVGVGKHLLDHGEIDAGDARFQAALAVDPDHVVALFQSGWVASKRDRWSEAHALWERASSLDAGHLDAKMNTGWALGRLGRWQEALAIFDALIVDRPAWVLARTNRAWVLENLGRIEESAAENARALALQAGKPDR
jgi:hypothetical protein